MDETFIRFLIAIVMFGLGLVCAPTKGKRVYDITPSTGEDNRTDDEKQDDLRRADRDAPKGSVQHLMIRLGYYPVDEEHGEALVVAIIEQNEILRARKMDDA